MIDFPASPVAGQIFFGTNGVAYQYSSTYTSWIPISASAPSDAAFHATSSAGSQIAPSVINTWETINPTTILSGNVGGYYNSATGVFTPPAGRYFVYGEMSFNSSASAMIGQMRIRKNGATIYAQDDDHTAAANSFTGSHVYAIIDCNGTDTIEVQAQCSVLMSNAQGQMGAFSVAQANVPIGGGSSWRQIARTSVSVAQATLDFQNIPTDINDLELRFDFTPVTDAVDLIARWYDAGGVLLSAGYGYTNQVITNGQALASAPAVSNNAGAGGISTGVMINYPAATRRVDNSGGIRGRIWMNNIRDTSRAKAIDFMGNYLSDDGIVLVSAQGSGWRSAAGGATGLQLAFSSGNIAVGSTATLWGSP